MLTEKDAAWTQRIDELQDQIDNLKHQVGDLTKNNEELNAHNSNLEVRVKEISGLKTENKLLEDFKAAHVKYCQKALLDLLTVINIQNGSDEETAALDAMSQYPETYGLEFVEQQGE